jgi:purine-nucleoside phosphorylase
MNDFKQFSAAAGLLKPSIAIVLGSGQSDTLSALETASTVSFAEVPGLSAPSIAGHAGAIIAGRLHGRPILVFQGRLHFYEGHAWDQVAVPIQLAARLGVRSLLLTNAAGGIHPSLSPGSLMAIRDHLFLQRPRSWLGQGPVGCACILGERPSPYSTRLTKILREAGREIGEELLAGVYAAVTGPSYETSAEIRALRSMGADAVGMSTAHEIEVGQGLGLECAALSSITNKAAGLAEGTIDHREVIQSANQSRARLERLLEAFVQRVGD